MMHHVQRLVVQLHFLVVVAVKHRVVMHLLQRGLAANRSKAVRQYVNC
jgi:hypothetical protein